MSKPSSHKTKSLGRDVCLYLVPHSSLSRWLSIHRTSHPVRTTRYAYSTKNETTPPPRRISHSRDETRETPFIFCRRLRLLRVRFFSHSCGTANHRATQTRAYSLASASRAACDRTSPTVCVAAHIAFSSNHVRFEFETSASNAFACSNRASATCVCSLRLVKQSG